MFFHRQEERSHIMVCRLNFKSPQPVRNVTQVLDIIIMIILSDIIIMIILSDIVIMIILGDISLPVRKRPYVGLVFAVRRDIALLFEL